ncbi:hypothetical protein [Cutibacterium modestum]|uniref:hypothetical protein n=2 Tax=Bacillati TaxID=1783272 RepID=UPI0035A0A1F0
MKRTILTGAVAACLGMAAFVTVAPGARAEGVPVPVPTSKVPVSGGPTDHLPVHGGDGTTRLSCHHTILPPEIRGGTIYLPDISAGPIILPAIKGGTITLPDISGRPIVLPKIKGGTVSIPPITFPSLRAAGNIRVNGIARGLTNGRGNFLAAGGMGAPASRPMALPRTGA